MRVQNTTGQDLYVPAIGDVVAAGAEVDVDSDTGHGLVEQGWTSAAQKAARRREKAKADDTPTEADEAVTEPAEGVTEEND